MGRPREAPNKACPYCGARTSRESGQMAVSECMACLRVFHVGCLIRVRKVAKDGQVLPRTYYVCPECVDREPTSRLVVSRRDRPKWPLMDEVLARRKLAGERNP